MSAVLGFGQDARWRDFLVSRVAVDGASRVLDVATGTAAVARELAKRNGARIVGLDQSGEMLRGAVEALRRHRLEDRIALVRGQAERLPFPDASFDAVTFTYLLRYVDDPGAALAELARVLRLGGTLACLEFAVPRNPLWRTGWWLYTRLGMPVIGAGVSRAWGYTGRFLGRSISDFYRRYPLPEQGRMWRAAGFPHPRFRTMSLGVGIVIWGEKSG